MPNQLTVSRFILTVLFLIAIFVEFPFSYTCALILFCTASITDYFDGKIARRDGLITTFGVLMDPLVDKILTCSAFIAFVGLTSEQSQKYPWPSHNLIPAWMVVVIVARELAITGLRLLAASKNVVLAAEGYGKHKTISQIIAIISVLVLISYPEWGNWSLAVFDWWVPWFTEIAKWVAVLLTFLSGGLYLWHNRQLYLSEM